MGIMSAHYPSKRLQVLEACIQFAVQVSGSAIVGLHIDRLRPLGVALADGGRLIGHVSADVLA